jgi:hypothetical protein
MVFLSPLVLQGQEPPGDPGTPQTSSLAHLLIEATELRAQLRWDEATAVLCALSQPHLRAAGADRDNRGP